MTRSAYCMPRSIRLQSLRCEWSFFKAGTTDCCAVVCKANGEQESRFDVKVFSCLEADECYIVKTWQGELLTQSP